MSEMRDLIATLPEQLRWAADLDPPVIPPRSEAVIAGMGGSGIAGDIAAVIAEAQGARVTVHKSYGLPEWVGGDTVVVAVSHSGATEETLSAAGEALERGIPLVTVSVGGELASLDGAIARVELPDSPQPRAAAGRLSGSVLRVLEGAGVLSSTGDDLREAASVVEEVLADADSEVDRIAGALRGRVTVIYGGAGVGAVAAGRWKAQINENGKAPAFWATLPEANHNEIVGWTALPDLSRDSMAVVFLEDEHDHPRVTLRSTVTRELMARSVPIAGVVTARGISPLARIMALSVVGDLVSVRLAELADVDPVPVEIIEDLKQRLADE
ncbi:MAG: bifunctional phosphoglucose/phosphomannose isomerase [Acidimicrobiia bacterium]